MHFTIETIAAAMLTLLPVSNAHLILQNPVPFGKSTLNNSPLVDAKPGESGSDYPCKQRPGVYDITTMNYMKVGDPQLMTFEGSASHGGGTCQVAVSLDEKPTANSTFKIIQVFEGGCPVDSDGNGETNPFTFTIPDDFPNGVSTLTWLWYNRIGNREAYMNCAPITVSGGSDNLDFYNSLPNMYVINLPTSECETGDGSSVAVSIPHPGQFIMSEPAGQSITAASGPSCAASAAAQTEGVVGYKSNIVTTNGAAYKAPATNGDSTGAANAKATAASDLKAGSGASATSPASSSATSTGAPSASASSAETAPASSTSAAGSASTSASSAATASSSSMASSSSASSFSQLIPSGSAGVAPTGTGAAAPSGTGSSSSSSSSSSCTSGSGMQCSSDGSKFGMCAEGKLVWQAVAPGTQCKNGSITKRAAVRVGGRKFRA